MIRERAAKRQYSSINAKLTSKARSRSTHRKSLNRFDCYNGFKSFKAFHTQQPSASSAISRRSATSEPANRSAPHQYSTLAALRRFPWLAGQPGYKSRIAYGDATISTCRRVTVGSPGRVASGPRVLEQVSTSLQKCFGKSIERRTGRLSPSFC